jgi:hypothetical protein
MAFKQVSRFLWKDCQRWKLLVERHFDWKKKAGFHFALVFLGLASL